ncbi:MAG: hypothetical protein ACXVB4_15960 [Pseudobdellovibrionaceae bacterium]
MMLRNKGGQALIESLALFGVISAILSVLGGLVYFGLVHVGMNYLLHEFLVCESTQNVKHCRGDFQQKAHRFLFAAQLTSIESRKTRNKQTVRIILKMPMNRFLKMQKELELYP